jgi:hypothetical protein
VRVHPSEGTLLGLVQGGHDGVEADALEQFTQGGLNAALGGVIDPQREDVAGGWRGSWRRVWRRKGVPQSEVCPLMPGVEGGPRDVMLTAQAGDDAVVAVVCQHGCRPLCPLLGRARMRLTHRVLPEAAVVGGTSTIASGSFFVRAPRPTVKLDRPF